MEGLTLNLTKALKNYACDLLSVTNAKILIVVESDDGDRFWAGNGKLRKEFINERRVENRNWGMREVDADGSGTNASDTNTNFAPEGNANAMPPTMVDVVRESSSLFDAYKVRMERQRSQLAEDDRGLCFCCGATDHFVRECPLSDGISCYYCKESGHLKADCPKKRRDDEVKRDTSRRDRRRSPNRSPNRSRGRSRDRSPNRSRDRNSLVECRYCHKRGHVLGDCPTRPENLRSVECRYCHEKGHMKEECPVRSRSRPVECSHCRQIGHMGVDCPDLIRKRKGNEERGSAIVCFNCLEPGHKRPDCPMSGKLKDKPSKENEIICHKCKEPGHKAPECKTKPTKPCPSCTSVCHFERDCPNRNQKRKDEEEPPVDVDGEAHLLLQNFLKSLKEEGRVQFTWSKFERKYLVMLKKNRGDDKLVKITSMAQLKSLLDD